MDRCGAELSRIAQNKTLKDKTSLFEKIKTIIYGLKEIKT